MKTTRLRSILSVFALFICMLSKSQTTYKTFTVIPFADLNNNCVYDMGEDTLVNFWVQVTDPINSMGASGTTYTNGIITGTINAPTTSTSYSVMLLQGLIQPCALSASGNIPYFTVYHLPINPVILNAPVGYGSTIWSPIQGKIYKYSPIDTLKYCSGSLNGGAYASSFIIHNNKQSASPFYNGNMVVKLDQNTIDTYTFVYAGSSTNFTSSASTGTLLSNFGGQNLLFNYNLPNTPLSAGIHTLTFQFSPFSGYTQPTIMKMVLNADSCGSVVGQTYLDCNNNCTKDIWETYGGNNISFVKLTSTTNTIITYPSSTGSYNVSAPIGIYTITANASSGSYSICPSVSFTTNITFASTYSLNYGVKEINASSIDYHTHFTLGGANPGPGAVPGGTLSITAYNGINNGPLCSFNPSLNPTALKLVLPVEFSFLNVIGSTPVPSTIITCASGDTIVWNNPGVNNTHKIAVYTATNAVIGNTYCVKSMIYPLTDVYSVNNVASRCFTFGGPFDPNEKTAEAIGMFPNGNILPSTQDITYTIEFQNLGNGSAVNISINDTIDTNLDLSTLEVISSSFPVQTQINLGTRVVDFKFKNIYLASAQVNESASHGYVKYKLKLNPSLPIGTSIRNRAHIYFDYNTAITTNKTVNTIATTNGISENDLSNSILLYPNPTNGAINIHSDSFISNITVYNVIGQVSLLTTNVNAKKAVVDLGSLENGVYFIRLQTENGIVTRKVVKH